MKTKDAISLIERFNEYARLKVESGAEEIVIPLSVIKAIGIVLHEIEKLTLSEYHESK